MKPDDFHRVLQKLRPVIGEMADTFWWGALLDPTREKDLHAVAQALAAELLEESYTGKHLLLEPPPSKASGGEYPLGTVLYGNRPVGRFGLREHEWPQHLLVVGRSGAGKTNVGYLLVGNLLRRGKPFLVLDYRRNYAPLRNRPEGQKLRCLSVGAPGRQSLAFNPLEPPPHLSSQHREAYLRDLIAVLCTTYLPGNHLLSTRGVEYLLLQTLAEKSPERAETLSFKALRRRIAAYSPRSREAEWKVTAESMLLKLTTGPLGQVLNGHGGVRLPELLDQAVILELDGLGSPTDQAALGQMLFLWLYYYRLTEGKATAFKHALIVEEAHHLFLKRPGGTQSVQDRILRQLRDLGEAVVILDQHPALLSLAVANTYTTICLNLKHADDVAAAGKFLTLPREEWEMIGRLPVGQAIVKLQDRHVRPFLVRFPRMPLPQKPASSIQRSERGVSLQRMAQGLPQVLREAIRAFREGDRKEKKEKKGSRIGRRESRIGEQESRSGEEERGMGKRERNLLQDVARHPFAPVTERYRRQGWTAHTGTQVQRSLREKGWLEPQRVGTPWGQVVLLELTAAGRRQLEKEGVRVPGFPKNAGLEHEYWKEQVAQHFRERGYGVEKEVALGAGQAVDVVATGAGERVAVEIETGRSNAVGNIRKALGHGFDRVLAVGLDTEVQRAVQGQLARAGGAPHPRVQVLSLGELWGRPGRQAGGGR